MRLRFALMPLSDANTMERIDNLCNAFMDDPNQGNKRQALLQSRAESHPNWLEKWWDGSYLSHRGSLQVDMNYFLEVRQSSSTLDQSKKDPVRLAARLLRATAAIRLDAVSEKLPAESDRSGPLCMSQYARVFGHARRPGLGSDTLACFEPLPAGMAGDQHFATEHGPPRVSAGGAPVPGHVRWAAVIRKGRMYRVMLTQEDGSPRPDLEASIRGAVLHADAEAGRGGELAGMPVQAGASLAHDEAAEVARARGPTGVAALTALPRDDAARARAVLETSSPAWAETFRAVDEATVVLCMDDWAGNSRGVGTQAVLHGVRAGDRWFDKHCIAVQPDGRATLLLEHAQGDGTAILPWVQRMAEAAPGDAGADDDGVAPGEEAWKGAGARVPSLEAAMQHGWEPLEWDAGAAVPEASAQAGSIIAGHWDSLETAVVDMEDFGALHCKKTLKCGADALAQLAIQSAQWATYGTVLPTYESASTRRFLHGRTATVRSATHVSHRAASALWAVPLRSDSTERRVMLQALSRDAMEHHRGMAQMAVEGQDIDRHLLGLRLVGEEEGLPPAELLEDPMVQYSSRWRISTSHCGSEHTGSFGFGPVVEDGIGVGYMVRGGSMCFNVTGWKGREDPPTDPHAFAGALETSLRRLREVLDTTAPDSQRESAMSDELEETMKRHGLGAEDLRPSGSKGEGQAGGRQ